MSDAAAGRSYSLRVNECPELPADASVERQNCPSKNGAHHAKRPELSCRCVALDAGKSWQ